VDAGGSTAPHIALLDVDSYEAGLELASPSFNPNLKLICVGDSAEDTAWRSFQRPVDWMGLVQGLDELFAPSIGVDFDFDLGEVNEKTAPPGMKVSLLVGLSNEDGLYLRARLALAGLTDVDQADTAVQASSRISNRHYDLVILSLDLAQADPWALVQTLKTMPTPSQSIVVTTRSLTWSLMVKAEQEGCTGILEIPFNPRQVLDLLQKV
jgi:CheY-like chemotaxis protein